MGERRNAMGTKDEESLDAEETEEAAEEEDIEEEVSEREGSGEAGPPAEGGGVFAVSDNFDRRGSGGRYPYGAVVLVRQQQSMDVGTGT